MADKVTFYFGRHGETKLNAEKKLRAWIDEPLNRQGIQEAEEMADDLEKVMIDKIYSSDLKRAEKTAEIIADSHGLKVIAKKDFRPLNYGDLNGRPLSEIQDTLEELTQEWKKNPDTTAPEGESFTEFQDRNLKALEKILSQPDIKTIVLVGHLRNALLFHEFAKTNEALKGEEIQVMDGKEWAQEPGTLAKYEWSDGKLKFIGIIGGKKAKVGKAMIS